MRIALLVDTDVIIDLLRGRDDTVAAIVRVREQGVGISVMTYGELWEGVRFAQHPGDVEDSLARLLQPIVVLPIDQAVARRYGELRGLLRRAGTPVATADLLIAATAIEHDAKLVTRNARHFDLVPGLVWSRPADL